MCGICGVVGRPVFDYEVRGMLDAIKHRGPDDEGVLEADKIFLGHRRLSILDLSNAGHQPMHFQNYSIVYNGEIYNFVELKDKLKSLGHQFYTGTDTEVILHAYAEWGVDSFAKLRGMWAFCIYDHERNEIVLCRDRFGIKPLYYSYKEAVLCFASEIPALFQAGIKAQANISRVVAYLMARPDISDTNTDTFFYDINQLSGGSYLTYNMTDGRMEIQEYYNLFSATDEETRQDYRDEFITSVEQHLRSDVLIGTCLSGGLDSSTLAAIAQKKILSYGFKPMSAVTAKSEDRMNDESGYANLVASHCSLDWKITSPHYDDFVKYHRNMLKMQAEPVGGPSIFMQYCVMKKSKEIGIKVMLDGQGGDETLLGYERYYVPYLMTIIKEQGITSFVKSIIEISHNSKLSKLDLIKHYVCLSNWHIHKMYLAKRTPFIKSNLKQDFFKEYRCWLKQSLDIKKMQVKEITQGNLPALLRYEDRNSMCFSIESRVPYVDHILVEKAINMDLIQKIHNGWTKYSLRKIAHDLLPESIAWRRDKLGFEAPDKVWITRYTDAMQEKVDDSCLLKEILTYIPRLKDISLNMRWRLYNLAVWEEDYLK